MSDNKKPEDHTDSLEEDIKKGIKELPTLEDKLRAVALNNLLNDKKKLDTEMEKEMSILNNKYIKLALPLLTQQSEIIEGKRGPTDEELVDMDKFLTEDEKAKKAEILESAKTNVGPIPEFWLKVLKNCDLISQEVQEKDEPALKALQSISFEKIEGTENMSITFKFGENEYFTNTVLTQIIHSKEQDVPTKAEGCTIEWKEGKNLTVKMTKKKQKNKKTGKEKVVTKEVEDESFFNFFKEADQDDDDEDEQQEGSRLEQINDIAQMIVDEVIPYSLEHYLGIKMEADDEDMDDEDDDDFDDDDDEEEEEVKPKKGGKKAHKKSDASDDSKGKSKKGKGKAPVPGQDPKDCKQQ